MKPALCRVPSYLGPGLPKDEDPSAPPCFSKSMAQSKNEEMETSSYILSIASAKIGGDGDVDLAALGLILDRGWCRGG